MQHPLQHPVTPALWYTLALFLTVADKLWSKVSDKTVNRPVMLLIICESRRNARISPQTMGPVLSIARNLSLPGREEKRRKTMRV